MTDVRLTLATMMGQLAGQKELFSYAVDLDHRIHADHPLRRVRQMIDFNFARPRGAHVRSQRYSITRLDNNLVENAIRPSAIGKKNWLFIGHPDAGKRTAILYSIIISCLRHGHDPETYIRDLLTRLPTMSSKDDLDALTPSQWKAPPPATAAASA